MSRTFYTVEKKSVAPLPPIIRVFIEVSGATCVGHNVSFNSTLSSRWNPINRPKIPTGGQPRGRLVDVNYRLISADAPPPRSRTHARTPTLDATLAPTDK